MYGGGVRQLNLRCGNQNIIYIDVNIIFTGNGKIVGQYNIKSINAVFIQGKLIIHCTAAICRQRFFLHCTPDSGGGNELSTRYV